MTKLHTRCERFSNIPGPPKGSTPSSCDFKVASHAVRSPAWKGNATRGSTTEHAKPLGEQTRGGGGAAGSNDPLGVVILRRPSALVLFRKNRAQKAELAQSLRGLAHPPVTSSSDQKVRALGRPLFFYAMERDRGPIHA